MKYYIADIKEGPSNPRSFNWTVFFVADKDESIKNVLKIFLHKKETVQALKGMSRKLTVEELIEFTQEVESEEFINRVEIEELDSRLTMFSTKNLEEMQ